MANSKMSVLFLRGIPAEIKADFKVYCARRGVSMKSMILAFMDRELKKEQRREIRRTAART